MASVNFAFFAALFSAFTAIELFPFLQELQSAQAASTTLDIISVVHVLLPLAAVVILNAAVAFIHLHHATAVGADNQRMSELVPFILCGAVGTLVFSLCVLPTGIVDGDVGALARALGRAALHALPASAAVVLFLGITLLIAHIRAGGEGGGGAAAVDRRVPAPVDFLKKIALGAAAALLVQIAIAALYVN